MSGYVIGQTADLVIVLVFIAFWALVVVGIVALCLSAARGDRIRIVGTETDDEIARARRRRERMQEREAQAVLRPPRDVMVFPSGREPSIDDFRAALREGKRL